MKEVKKILLSKLLNLEIRAMMENVINILKTHNLEEMRLQDIFDVLQMQMPIAQTLDERYGKHPITPKLARLHKKRLMYASLINAHVKALLNADDEQMQAMAIIARRLTKKHLIYLGQIKRAFVENQLSQFFLTIDSGDYNPEREALKALGVGPLVNELRSANVEYQRLYKEREQDKKERARKGNPIVRKETLRILRLSFEKISANQIIYKDVDYSQLVHELNLLLTANSKRIKTRIATNKRRARKKAEVAKKAAAKKS